MAVHCVGGLLEHRSCLPGAEGLHAAGAHFAQLAAAAAERARDSHVSHVLQSGSAAAPGL